MLIVVRCWFWGGYASEKLIAHNAARTAAGRTPQQPDQIVAEYIKLLTEYNRVRDAAQVVFDKVSFVPFSPLPPSSGGN